MDYVVCSHHSPSLGLVDFWTAGTIGPVPEPLRLLLNCTQDEFVQSVVHTHVSHVCRDVQDHAEFSADVILRRDAVTRVLRTQTRVVKLPTVHACLTHVTDVVDARSDSSDAFLDHLECLVRTNAVPWRRVHREGVDYVAVRNTDAPPRTDTTRAELTARRCRANQTITYTDDRGSVSHRSILVPSCLVDTSPVRVHHVVWGVVCLVPTPRVVHGATAGIVEALSHDVAYVDDVAHDVDVVRVRTHAIVRLFPRAP